MQTKTVHAAGELGLIRWIARSVDKNGRKKKSIVGIGDDCAVVPIGKRLCLLTVDALIDGIHFSQRWSSPEEIGRKAIEVNVSDIVAKGGYPVYALVSLIIPPTFPLKKFQGIYRGIISAAAAHDVEIVGGNLSRGRQLIIDISLVGFVGRKNVRLRSDAKPGDLIMVTGNLGDAAAGLELLRKNTPGFAPLKSKYLKPTSSGGKVKGFIRYIHAMEDISDGLAAEAMHICEQSKVGAVLYPKKVPLSPGLRKASRLLRKDPLSFALFGGDDYELVFTIPSSALPRVKGFVVGQITRKPGIFLSGGNISRPLRKHGFEHF